METRQTSEHFCPLEHAAQVLNGKWKLKIIWYLAQAPTVRFNALKRQIGGVTDLMLTKSLKELVSAQVVERQQFNEVPPRVEYSLTPQGRGLLVALEPLANWSQAMLDERQD